MIIMQMDDNLLLIGIEPADLAKLARNDSPMISKAKSGLNKEIALFNVPNRDALEYAVKELAPQAALQIDESFNLGELANVMKKYPRAANDPEF